jgi:hypothetical protein
MRKLTLGLVLALAVPSMALAAKPPTPNHSQSKSAPKVLYVLKGTLTAYSNPGTVTITVSSANHYGSLLEKKSLSFAVNASTKVVGTFAVNDKGIVKVRAAKKIAAADLLTTLQAQSAFQVIDQGASS